MRKQTHPRLHRQRGQALVETALMMWVIITVVFFIFELGWLMYTRSEEHTSELQSHLNLVCRLLLEKKKQQLAHQPNPNFASSPVRYRPHRNDLPSIQYLRQHTVNHFTPPTSTIAQSQNAKSTRLPT